MAALYVESKKYNFGEEELLDRVLIVLGQCGFKVKFMSMNHIRIFAQTKFNIWCWMENIEVIIETNGNVTMKSESLNPYRVIDYGKNRRNVKRFFKKLNCQL